MALGPLIIDVDGLTLSEVEADLLKHPAVGGVIFFIKNYDNPTQFRALVAAIRQVRPELLLTVDQEGGRVQRFKTDLTLLSSMQDLAQTQSLAKIEAAGTLMALEMRALGIDMSFAPVLDCDKGLNTVIGSRAFHSSPKEVASMGEAFAKGMKKANMPATGKHFPGHGSVKEDSHHALPVDDRAFTLLEADLFPFHALIKAGLECIMTAHIVYPAVDSKPASFSKVWLNDILRGQLKFEGVIFSDDLAMGGAVGMGSYSDRVHAALGAGCDFAFICHQRAGVVESIQFLESRLTHYPHRRERLKILTPVATWDTLNQHPLYQECLKILASKEKCSSS